MMHRTLFYLICFCVFITACADQNTLTKAEIETQNRADAVVSNVLFEHELDALASYNVHKNGFLVIKFAKSVSQQQYSKVVDILRLSSEVNGVTAEQGGREICILKSNR